MMIKRKNVYAFFAIVTLTFLFSFGNLFCQKFSFVFMTDIHLRDGKPVKGFNMAINAINKLNPDFVLTGGDLVSDVTKASYAQADKLYNLYTENIRHLKMPVYNTIGNHDIFALANPSESGNPEYLKKMYEKRIGKRYYSFDHNGWHFIVLDAVGIRNHEHIGYVDKEQIEWLKSDLKKTGKTTPIIVSEHIPFDKGIPLIFKTALKGRGKEANILVTNTKEVLKVFDGYNLKLVLDGHIHVYNQIRVDGVDYVTGGSVSGQWWRGPMLGTPQGFLLVTIDNGKATWKYMEFGWKGTKE